ncbi:MAG: hypothetical protein ABW076_08480 [Candidatus Thiodiazotropha sp.]
MKSLFSLMLAGWLSLTAGPAHSGAACVVAKRQGDSLAIEWIASPRVSAAEAIDQATSKLLAQGYRIKGQDVHAQANTDLAHAYLVIVKTRYTTLTGRQRTSYGCGYSPRSAAEAEQAALYDLRNYSWGWKPELGYEVMVKSRY